MIKQPKSKSSHHKVRYCAVVFVEGTIETVIVSANPMWSAAIYAKAKTKKDGIQRGWCKAILREPKTYDVATGKYV